MGYRKQTEFMTNTLVEERVKSHLRDNQRSPNQISWLNKIDSMIKEKGKRLFIVIPPYRSDYKTLLPEKEIIFSHSYTAKIEKSNIIDFFNYREIDDYDMGDTEHALESGVIKATEFIRNFIVNW